jgi:hypothetical protein
MGDVGGETAFTIESCLETFQQRVQLLDNGSQLGWSVARANRIPQGRHVDARHFAGQDI